MSTQLAPRGLYVALTTPFTQGGAGVDTDALSRHVNFLIQQGVHGLVPCGTTGETPTLSPSEQRLVIRTTVRAADGRVPIVAGVGTNSTALTIERASAALEEGVDGLLVVTPYYNRPPQEGLFRHFATIADSVQAPLILYNVPSRTSVDLEVDTAARLAELPNIVAIKDATGDLRVGSNLVGRCRDRMTVLSGDDFTTLPLLAVGGHGAISVMGNVAPRRSVQMVDAALNGDMTRARRLHHELVPLLDRLFAVTNPVPVKYAVSLLGFGEASVRSPLPPLDDSARDALTTSMRQLELI